MAYLKPQSPIKNGEDHVYPLTMADQVILSDGSRLEQNGVVVAGKLNNAHAISLTGDVTGAANFDGSEGITINTSVSAAKYYNVTFLANAWSTTAPYAQAAIVEGIKASDNPIVDINMTSATLDNSADLLESWALVGRIVTGNNIVTAYCYDEAPTVDISVNIVVIK